jgi:hypothetical protein
VRISLKFEIQFGRSKYQRRKIVGFNCRSVLGREWQLVWLRISYLTNRTVFKFNPHIYIAPRNSSQPSILYHMHVLHVRMNIFDRGSGDAFKDLAVGEQDSSGDVHIHDYASLTKGSVCSCNYPIIQQRSGNPRLRRNLGERRGEERVPILNNQLTRFHIFFIHRRIESNTNHQLFVVIALVVMIIL